MCFSEWNYRSVGGVTLKNNLPSFFPSKQCYNKAAMPPPADIVKVAIEWPGANAQLIEMDQVCVCTQLHMYLRLHTVPVQKVNSE